MSVIFTAAAVWFAVWAVSTRQPLGVALGLILLGFACACLYEALAIWPGSSLLTVSEIANQAFTSHRPRWVGIQLVISLVAGALTMHFTRLVQADWAFLGATILVLVNGALLAYWFEWLP